MPDILLRIDASSRREGSHSRSLADAFERSWLAGRPAGQIVRRDLAASPVAHIAPETIAGFSVAPEQLDDKLRRALKVSDYLIEELLGASEILVSTPMYNFTIPSALKAYIDHVVRVNKTFAYDGSSFSGLVPARRAIITSAFGAGGYTGKIAAADYVTPYLRFLFGFLGVAVVENVTVEATTGAPEAFALNIEGALDRARALATAA